MIGDAWWNHPLLWMGLWLAAAMAWWLLGRRALARPVLVLAARHVHSWVLLAGGAVLSLAPLWLLMGVGVLLIDERFWLAEGILMLVLAVSTLLSPLVVECIPMHVGHMEALTADLRDLGAPPRAAAVRAWVLGLWSLGMLMVMITALLGVVLPVLERLH